MLLENIPFGTPFSKPKYDRNKYWVIPFGKRKLSVLDFLLHVFIND